MRPILASFLLLTAACTQTPAEIVYKGNDSFTRTASNTVSGQGMDIRQEPTSTAAKVDSIQASDLPPPSKM